LSEAVLVSSAVRAKWTEYASPKAGAEPKFLMSTFP